MLAGLIEHNLAIFFPYGRVCFLIVGWHVAIHDPFRREAHETNSSLDGITRGLVCRGIRADSAASEIAPGGKLRVGMIAITVLGGVADPVARFIGQKLGAAVEPVMYPNPEVYLQSFGKGEWDIAIGPRVLAPADKADSTADLWVISLVHVAAPGKEFPDIASVDKAGVKIGTIRGAPSDRVLTREIKAAEVVRIPLSPTIAADAGELLRSGKADVFGADAGVGYPAARGTAGRQGRAGRLCDGSCGGCAAEKSLYRGADRTRNARRRSKAERRGAEGHRREGSQGRERRREIARYSGRKQPVRMRETKSGYISTPAGPMGGDDLVRRAVFYSRSTRHCAEWSSPTDLSSNSVPSDRIWGVVYREISRRQRLMAPLPTFDPEIIGPSSKPVLQNGQERTSIGVLPQFVSVLAQAFIDHQAARDLKFP
jgi:polar amino acid transport system substrate-binding protein